MLKTVSPGPSQTSLAWLGISDALLGYVDVAVLKIGVVEVVVWIVGVAILIHKGIPIKVGIPPPIVSVFMRIDPGWPIRVGVRTVAIDTAEVRRDGITRTIIFAFISEICVAHIE